VTLRLPAEWKDLGGDRLLNRVRGLARLIGCDGRVVVG